MKPAEKIPYYAPDGTSLGFRSLAAAKRLIAGGFVKPSYGRKGHLKAIWLRQEDGSDPVDTHAPGGTRYSFLENMEHGRCWKLRRLDRKDEDGTRVNTRGVFLQVIADCGGVMKSQRRQIGGRYLARVRGAFRGGWATPEQAGGPSGQPRGRRRNTGQPGATGPARR